ncbi:MAG: hypothetical protein EXR71_14855 [Myxococcales bacterium]|nr:hypothetical protein [Myxococcales bacterium]
MLSLVILLAGCQAEIERQCYIEFIGATNDETDEFFDCYAGVDTEADAEECSDDLTDDADSIRDDVEECAGGEGCLADFLDCSEDVDNEREGEDCYEELEECGGWFDSDAAKDCDEDFGSCVDGADDVDDAKRCYNRVFDCLIEAAGGS